MNKLKYLVIHCTATPEGRLLTSVDIRRMHCSPPPIGHGWKVVGYTDMFYLNGEIERLVYNNEDNNVDNWEITNGATGINSISRHVVYVGGMTKDMKSPKDTRTPEQFVSMKKYVLDFVLKHPECKVAGHYQFANKACPSFNVVNWCRQIGVPEKNIYIK